ncbi:histidine phosphatase family protein [Piscinibacter sp.]|uniref:histidine phosphatase family protein n=1 Tax=Piscinibacter sp. TaxID=1903157 RepID=UPI002B74AE3D|nr:histidine phosphatase family protein [Albitalea sp.]HUG23717.1 histidine phosphatase family protein [Albitalea sp.]
MRRRRAIQGLLLLALPGGWRVVHGAADEERAGDAQRLLREGGAGLVVAMRHALAPGTFDPPGFRLDDCSTQRNLNDKGRAQARRLGAWFRQRSLAPTAVRASQWCRCLETARLAFGNATPWPALNSLVNEPDRAAPQTEALRAELARLANERRPGFEVWVTHQVNIRALTQRATGPGDAVLLRHDARLGAPAVLAMLQLG